MSAAPCVGTDYECDCDCECGRDEYPENCKWPDCGCDCAPTCKGCALALEVSPLVGGSVPPPGTNT